MEAALFLEELVRCYSPSGKEGQVSARAVEVMQSLGFRDAHSDEVGNAVGYYGSTSGPKVLLLGHIDTVTGEVKVRHDKVNGEDVLYGRGTVDAKGPFATFVQAVSRLPEDIPCTFIVVGAVEEEARSSKGARHVLANFDQPECVIIGEPSGGTGITLGYKGRLLQELRLSRAMAHSASQYMSIGDYLSLWAAEVHRTTELLNEERKHGFQSLDCTVQRLHVTDNGLTEVGELELGFRLGPDFDPYDLDAALMKRFNEWLAVINQDASLKVDVKCVQHEVPAQFERKSDLASCFRRAIRECGGEARHVLKTGTSDMNVLASRWTCPMVAYGPGDSSLDHTPHEHIVLSEYTTAIDILEKTLLNLANKLGSA